MKAAVITLGCKVNEVESATMLSALEAGGFCVTDKIEYADIYILNTCAVTREAEKKSRQLISRVSKHNPNAKIYICGCASEKDREAFLKRGVHGVYGARDKEKIIEDICGSACTKIYPKQMKTRGFVKIEDGCDNFCSYCIIPYLRGRVTSRPAEQLVREIESTPSEEIVLTGINISAYNDGGKDLTGLMHALKDVNKRIRIGSLECEIISERLLEALKELKDFAAQFHLSLQSGSDRVLKAMNRHYTREEYLQKCRMIYSAFPDGAITTDIIAGFPSETDEDFYQSLSLIKEAGFAKVHAFAFSPREGTAAYKMKDLPSEVKSGRLHKLLQAGEEARFAFLKAHEGKKEKVLWEEYDGEYTSGYTGNYIRVYAKGERHSFENITLGRPFKDGAYIEE